MISDPLAKVEEYVTHRLAREAAVLAALRAATRGVTVEDLVKVIYTDVPEPLHPIARFSVWAHLRKLADEGRAAGEDPNELSSTWSAVR